MEDGHRGRPRTELNTHVYPTPPLALRPPSHLAAVRAEMSVRGAPVIKAVWQEVWGAWVALEGAHRLRAADDLGLIPIIDEVEWSETVTTDDVVPGSLRDCWTIERMCDDAVNSPMLEFPRDSDV